jgi:hypothetical protein
VDNKEQVNQFSTDELKQLFSLRQDTRSDTHDTLRCKRCNSVKVLDYNTDKKKISDAQIDACLSFLDDFSQNLINIATMHREKEAVKSGSAIADGIKLPFEDDITLLRNQLLNKEIQSLPIYSRKQRETFLAIDSYHSNAKKEYSAYTQKKILQGNESTEAVDPDIEEYAILFPSHYSLFSEFLKSWTDMVSKLSSLAGESKNCTRANTGDGEGDGDGDGDDSNSEFVEQEGCPEETDFNKWSHHCSVDTCDDDILMKSMG